LRKLKQKYLSFTEKIYLLECFIHEADCGIFASVVPSTIKAAIAQHQF